jgi:hypothetical protein
VEGFDVTPDRWSRIEALYHDARARAAPDRSGFLDRACEGDAALRREVESLLDYDAAADGFLERPAIEGAAVALAQDSGTTLVGQRIGGYHILSLLARAAWVRSTARRT